VARKPKVLPPLDWLAPRLRLTRTLSLACFFGLMALLVANNLWFANLHGARVEVILAVELVPLLLLLPGMLTGSARAHAWTCFVVNIYFIKGVLAAFDPARAVFGWIEVIVSLGLFVSALLFVRWKFQHERRLAGEGA
jgi:Predicted membrane protein